MQETRNSSSKRKFKVWYIVVAVVLLIALFVGVFAIRQRKNISAIYSAVTSSTEEIESKQKENSGKMDEALN